jgi:hypothetical protein
MQKQESFLKDISKFIENAQRIAEKRGSYHCGNCFENENQYDEEKELIREILDNQFSSQKVKGDCLEKLIKKLFSRIQILQSVDCTSYESNIGQIDIQINMLEEDTSFDVLLGIKRDFPSGIIGECKNYPNKDSKVSREDIEKMCWRTCKRGCVSFFISFYFTGPAIAEIGAFNLNCCDICCRCGPNSRIVPITIDMISLIIENNINFCYFLKWAFHSTRLMSINSYLG